MLSIFKKVCRSEFGEHYLLLAENLPTSRPRKPPFPPTSDYSIGRTLVTPWSDGGKKEGTESQVSTTLPCTVFAQRFNEDLRLHDHCWSEGSRNQMGVQSADVHSQQASSHNVLTIVISLIRLIPHPYSDVLICSFSQTNSNGNALVF